MFKKIQWVVIKNILHYISMDNCKQLLKNEEDDLKEKLLRF